MIENPETRHPDIEIYIFAAKASDVEAWLQQQFEQLEQSHQQGGRTDYRATTNGITIPVMVIEKAAGKFTSVWFDSAVTPWSRDLDCARAAAAAFHREVRCIASGWQEGDDPDEWWSITTAEEKIISWRNA
ncbi:hypothetical protein [Motiliproteus sediminis]|uniref:hypothetical protein n=1 Tax=Motiliproteus sediminis TaxID=1468178 RepID=UPI001FE710C9|nr:hypothetical protein [Motiliproteus sediminis]